MRFLKLSSQIAEDSFCNKERLYGKKYSNNRFNFWYRERAC